MSKVEEKALMAYPEPTLERITTDVYREARKYYQEGYEQAEKDIISIIESRLAELRGDAQPAPILRYELWDLLKIIKEENNG